MAFPFKGQGATEYLVMLAAILIVALVALAILGFFPGISSDAKVSQSASYWRSEAKPFAILEHSATSNGTLTLVMQNVDASGTVTVSNISVSNTSYASTIKFGPGEQRIVFIPGVEQDEIGRMYDFPINITYRSANGVMTMQYGIKTLIGRYT